MAKKNRQKQEVPKWVTSAILVMAGLVVFIGGGMVWWQKVYTSPRRVFWGMLENSLRTPGVTKRVTQSSADGSYDQIAQLGIGQNPIVVSHISVNQKSELGESTITTESIGTPTVDYVRYLDVQTTQTNVEGQPLDFSKIKGVWGKTLGPEEGAVSQARYLQEALLGIVPFGQLTTAQRKEVVEFMRQNNLYETSYDNISRRKENGRSVYVYEVSMKPETYVGMLQRYGKMVGLKSVGDISPEQYRSSPPLKMTFTVDVLSRQLVAIQFLSADGRTERYGGYGARVLTDIPASAISLSELQQRIQEVQ